MFYKEFKGNRISTLGLGVMRLPSADGDPNKIDRVEGAKIIDRAMELGINYFDTSHIYQKTDSERFLGEVMKKYPRDSYYLATKIYGSPNRDIRKTFAQQLERLQTDYVDFYLLHSLDDETFPIYTDPKLGYIDFLQEMRAAGKIRYLGFSTHISPEKLERFLQYFDGFDMALMQLNFVDWELLNAKRQYEILTEHGLPVWVMEPMKGGRLANLNDAACKILKEAAPERSVPSWGFRYLMGLPNVQTVLSGMGSLEMIEDNAATFHAHQPLDAQEQIVLRKAYDAYIGDMGVPCSGCRYCCDSCPEALNIPLLIRAYNEFSITGKTWRIVGLDKTKGPEHCVGCGACTRHCPQKINIPEVLKKLKESKIKPR